MNFRFHLVAVMAAVCVLCADSGAQTPLGGRARTTAQRTAGKYALDSAYAFWRDSIVFVFRDPALTPEAPRTKTWMFGPRTTKAEADGCPPEKVLGRRIARASWIALGRPRALRLVIVRVRGPKVGDPLDSVEEIATDLYYPRFQLTGPWVGDRKGDRR